MASAFRFIYFLSYRQCPLHLLFLLVLY